MGGGGGREWGGGLNRGRKYAEEEKNAGFCVLKPPAFIVHTKKVNICITVHSVSTTYIYISLTLGCEVSTKACQFQQLPGWMTICIDKLSA